MCPSRSNRSRPAAAASACTTNSSSSTSTSRRRACTSGPTTSPPPPTPRTARTCCWFATGAWPSLTWSKRSGCSTTTISASYSRTRRRRSASSRSPSRPARAAMWHGGPRITPTRTRSATASSSRSGSPGVQSPFHRRGNTMTRRHPIALVAICFASIVCSPAFAQQRAADGVAINEQGQPQYSTFSLCAIDPATGLSGAAVTTRVPFVGRAVPHVRAGVGAVCTQASTVVEYGPRGLDLLAKGVEPQAVLAQLLADDASRESRQVGVIDMKGRAAAHTGKQNGNWAGSHQGPNYTVQANIMVGPEVVEAVARTFEASEGTGMPLAERMILAMEAGYGQGGDRRWGNLQSAAIKVADPKDPGRGNDHITLAIEVGEHAEPVAELKRIYYTTGRRLGYRSFSRIEGPDVIELKRMLHGVGYWRPSLAGFP